MKLTSDRTRAMMEFCRLHRIVYVSSMQYSSAVNMAIKNRKRTPNGVLYHFPEYSPHMGRRFGRVYMIWCGESIAAIEEACAFFLMTTQRTDLFLIRTKKLSKRAQEIEQCITQLPEQ